MTIEITQEEKQALDILRHVWRGGDPDFKKEYSRTIWSIFESAIYTSAQHNSTLAGFAQELCRKMQSIILDDGMDEWVWAQRKGNDMQILDLLSTNTALLVALLRLELKG